MQDTPLVGPSRPPFPGGTIGLTVDPADETDDSLISDMGGIRVDFKEADDADRDARERELVVATKENTLEEAQKAHAEQVKLLKGEQDKLARREHITQTERTRLEAGSKG